MNESDSLYGSSLSVDSMKTIAESIGVGNLPDEAAKELSDELTYRLKHIIQVSLSLTGPINLFVYFFFFQMIHYLQTP